MGTAPGFLGEFGLCQDGIELEFYELPSGYIAMWINGVVTYLSPECYKRLAEFLLKTYNKESQVG